MFSKLFFPLITGSKFQKTSENTLQLSSLRIVAVDYLLFTSESKRQCRVAESKRRGHSVSGFKLIAAPGTGG